MANFHFLIVVATLLVRFKVRWRSGFVVGQIVEFTVLLAMLFPFYGIPRFPGKELLIVAPCDLILVVFTVLTFRSKVVAGRCR